MTVNCIDFNEKYQNELDSFFNKAFNSCGFFYEPLTKHVDLRNIKKVFIDTGGGFWILIEDSLVVGTVGLKPVDITKGIGELKCMYVLPNKQRNGFGQILLEKVFEELVKQNFNLLRLDVMIHANKAISLYKKNGFYEIQKYNDNPNKVLFMEKRIK